MCASELKLRLALALLLGTALAGQAGAQQAASREQELIRRLRQQVQQLQAEQGAGQQAAQRANAEKVEAQGRLDAAASSLRRAQQSAAERAKSVDEARKALEALRQENAALQVAAQALKSELQAREQALAAQRTEQQLLQRTLGQRSNAFADIEARHQAQAQGLQSCIANNQALHGVGRELLQAWLDKGVLDAATQGEPFFQFKRVQLQNLVQGYEDKLDRLALKPVGAGAAGPPREAGRVP